jgi:hypothetical protein
MKYRVLWNGREFAQFAHKEHANLYIAAAYGRWPWIEGQLEVEEME